MKKSDVLIGCSSFSVGYWKGIFYPEDLASRDYLAFYSTKFKTVEINSTFYHKPTAKTLERWRENTTDDFKIFIKMPKAITHVGKLENTLSQTAEFCDHISAGLQHKLAGFLFQLPPSFKNTPENLEKVLKTVDKKYLNVVEFRHESWWNNEIKEILGKNSLIFCGVSIPKNIPDDFIINDEHFAYYRFHGVPEMFKSGYSDEELEKFASEVKKFSGTSYLFFNNTFGVAAIHNALNLKKMLE